MGEFFFIFIAIFIGYNIFIQVGHKKLIWFFAGIMFVPETIILINYPVSLTFPRVLIIILLISSMSNLRLFIHKFEYFPIKSGLLIMLIAACCIGFFDSRISIDKKIVRSFSFFLEFFSTSFLCYVHMKTLKDLKTLYKTILIFFLIFCVYGIINYATKYNPYQEFVSQSFSSRNFAAEQLSSSIQRIRIASFAWHPIYYGFLVSIGILMTLLPLVITNKIHRKNNFMYSVILFLLVINLLLTNSRTPLYSVVFGLILFFLFGLNVNKKFKFGMLGVVFLLMAFTFVPSANVLLSESFKTFSKKGSDLEGSSVEMRNLQLAASIVQFNKSPILGNGFNYIVEGLGFSGDVDKIKSNQDFYGFESYSYKLLIEQGLVGMIGHILFFGVLFRYLLKNILNKNSLIRSRFAVLNVAMIFTFLLFIFGTGDLGSFKFFMSILGINIAGLEIMKNKEKLFLQANNNF